MTPRARLSRGPEFDTPVLKDEPRFMNVTNLCTVFCRVTQKSVIAKYDILMHHNGSHSNRVLGMFERYHVTPPKAGTLFTICITSIVVDYVNTL